MEMKKCERGHYFDASLHEICPYCKETNVGVTMPLGMQDGVTMPIFEAMNNAESDEGRTVALIKEDMGIDPVVGWLVCMSGTEKGRDYRIHSDNNYVGRSERMDICIRGDETISRENQAVITYDTKERSYFFSPGDGRSIVRINEKAVFQTMEIKAYDKLTIGKTVLLFIPLCGDEFEWEKE